MAISDKIVKQGDITKSWKIRQIEGTYVLCNFNVNKLSRIFWVIFDKIVKIAKNSKIERTLKCKQSFSLSEMCFFRRSLTDGFGSIGKISFTFSGLERLLTAFEHERMNFLVWPHCNPRNSFGALSESAEETLDEVTETLENKVKNY